MRRFALTLLTCLVTAFGLTIPVSAAAAPAGWACYSSYSQSCVSQFGYAGQSAWGYPVDSWGNNCTNYAAFRLSRNGAANPGNLGNAIDWDNNAASKGFPVDQSPAVGSIAQWNTGTFGHVAYVDWVSADGNEIAVSESSFHLSASIPSSSGRRVLTRGSSAWPSTFIHIKDVSGSVGLSDGQYISYAGNVFRIAGGAPLYVSTWDRMGGPQPTTPVSQAQFDSLRRYPADGTLISGQAPGHPEHGTVFRIAGGAPIYVSDFAHIGGGAGTVPVDLAAIHMAGNGSMWSHLRWYPADGTLISGHSPGHPETGSVYRVAGGAPVYVSDYTHIGGDPGTTAVDLAAIHNAGLGTVWDHLRYRPAEGTIISGQQPGDPEHGTLYRISGGAPVHVSSWAAIGGTPGSEVGVDLTAIRNAESGGVWNHLRYRPTDGTILNTGTDKYRVSSGAPYLVTDSAAGIRTDPAAIANAGGPGRWSHLSAPQQAPPPPTPTPPAPSTDSTPTTTAPPPATTPGSQTTQRAISLKSIKRASKLRVAIGPASATENYRFVVQQRVQGKWRQVQRSSTRGHRDVRLLNLRRGTYRIVVPAYDGMPKVVSSGVRLKR